MNNKQRHTAQLRETGKRQNSHRNWKRDNLINLRWTHRREVCMFTILHKDVNKSTGKTDRQTSELKMKPHSIMAGLIRWPAPQNIQEVTEWYKKLFPHFLGLALLNSQTAYHWQIFSSACHLNL
jgi:hypothetical protein